MATEYSKTMDWLARSLNPVLWHTPTSEANAEKKDMDTSKKVRSRQRRVKQYDVTITCCFQLFQAHAVMLFAPIKLIPKLPLFSRFKHLFFI